VSFHEVGEVPALPTPVEVALLRIAQAALGNTAQHSNAARADVTLTGMDTTVTLDIVDDGTGFDTRAAAATTPASTGQGGFGLRSMRSRAADVGGVLSVESHRGRGTAVSVHFDRLSGAPSAAAHTSSPAAGRLQ
jgi:signal transduction histidine kinase